MYRTEILAHVTWKSIPKKLHYFPPSATNVFELECFYVCCLSCSKRTLTKKKKKKKLLHKTERKELWVRQHVLKKFLSSCKLFASKVPLN